VSTQTNLRGCLTGFLGRFTGPRSHDSNRHAAEFGRGRGPGSGPVELRARRSAGASAPRSTSIQTSREDAHEPLLSVHSAGTAIDHVAVKDAPLQRRPLKVRLAKLVGQAVNHATKPNRAIQCLPLFPLLEPAQRGKLVDVVVNERNYGGSAACWRSDTTDWGEVRADHLSEMAQMLAYLDVPQQAKLVEAAFNFGDEADAAAAIAGFGAALAHLNEALRGRLVDKAIGLKDDYARATAIGGLSAGMAHLDPTRKECLLTAAATIENAYWKATALQNMCKGWTGMEAAQQAKLFDQVTALPAPWLAKAIQNLGSSLQHLSEDQRTCLFGLTLKLFDRNGYHAPHAIDGLAAGLEYLTGPQRDALVTTPLAHYTGEGRSMAMASLGPGLAHLKPELQDTLLDAAAGMDTPSHKAQAIAGLAAGLAALDPARQERVIGMALGLPDDDSKAVAIAALGPRLGDLKLEQQQALVDAAIGLFRTGAVSKKLSRTLSAALGAGLKHLPADLRGALVTALTRPLSQDEKGLRGSTGEAIAGLGAGYPYLDEGQYQALMAATKRLQNRSGWAPFRTPDHRVIVAFAAEAAKALDAVAQAQPVPASRG